MPAADPVGISAYSSSVRKRTDELSAPGYAACMISNHPASRARTAPVLPKRATGRPLWWATLAWIIACIAYSTVAFANLPVASWLPDAPQTVETRTAPAVRGVVETIRKFESVGTLPAGYEFTVRLRDGSTRISSDASAARWRVGDSIMLLGSIKPLI